MAALPSVDDALATVLAHVPAPERERRPVAECCGLVLAADVAADHDHPPFPRSKVDGWALRAADAGGAPLRVAARIAAGSAPGASIGPGEAARIFTGAPVPDGADAVAMQEDCAASEDGSNVGVPATAANRANVVPRGAECRRGDVVGRAGDLVTPGLVGALASVGCAGTDVYRAPAVRIVSTGDELVPCDTVPGPGRIRNSNAPALAAAARTCGADVAPDAARWAPDDAAALRETVGWALAADVVLLTGGVSVGDFDLVPDVLASLGVTKRLHGVRLQPGKPLWFGTRGRTLVFGLPGNPVSALVNTALFVRPAIARLSGRTAPGTQAGVLDGPLGKGTWRRKFVPVSVRRDRGGLRASPLPFQGSGDVFGFSRANGLAVIPEDAPARSAGEAVDLVPLFEAGAWA